MIAWHRFVQMQCLGIFQNGFRFESNHHSKLALAVLFSSLFCSFKKSQKDKLDSWSVAGATLSGLSKSAATERRPPADFPNSAAGIRVNQCPSVVEKKASIRGTDPKGDSYSSARRSSKSRFQTGRRFSFALAATRSSKVDSHESGSQFFHACLLL
jgi:hypothetical protein